MTFFNIFSKKEQKQEKTIPIIADHREKNALVIAELIKNGARVTYEQLAVADYLIGTTAIERKTVSDLKSSIINKRIMGQLTHLKQYKNYALLIEGIDKNLYEGIIHQNALRGFMWSVAFNHQVPLIYTLDERDTAQYLLLLTREKNKSESSIRATRPAMSGVERLQFILEGFPSIGPITAKKLLTEFKTVKGVMNAPEGALEKCIGKKAQEFIRLIKEEYRV